jgi:sulfate permease, SulP family
MDVQAVTEDPRFGISQPSRSTRRQEWFGNVRHDLLAGTVVALALIPEAIAFSIIAGVDPKVGLYAAFIIATVIAFVGGRPAMVSAATGAMALLMIDLVRDHGLPYLFAATILTGIIQIVFGWKQLGRYMKFVPRPVMVGFVNALAILIFMAQLPQLAGGGWLVWSVVAIGLAIIYLLPRITTAVPSPLVAIVGLTLLSLTHWGDGLRRVGDMGTLPTALPWLALPQVPLTFETLRIIVPISFALALVGLIESLLTASIVDEMTDTASDKHRESRGQGIANIVAGLFGGMAGCAMIGQSVINVKSGGRGRLSTLAAGILLLFFILVLSKWLVLIPMGALVAVMFMVSIGTFDWHSLRSLRRTPGSETLVMVVTVATVVATHDLAIGVLTGVVLSALIFARRIARCAYMENSLSEDGRTRIYTVTGQLFFVTVTGFLSEFDYQEPLDRVVIDLTHSHIWDGSAVAAIDKVVLGFRRRGVTVDVVGMNDASSTLLELLAVHDKPGAEELVPGH